MKIIKTKDSFIIDGSGGFFMQDNTSDEYGIDLDGLNEEHSYLIKNITVLGFENKQDAVVILMSSLGFKKIFLKIVAVILRFAK